MSRASARRYLDLMGISVWVRRGPGDRDARVGAALDADAAPAAEAPGDAAFEARLPAAPAPRHGTTPAEGAIASMDWASLAAAVSQCTRCELHRTRTQTVFGVGDRGASCLIIGEAPGGEEDRRGEPFVGPAGQLLNAMLAAIGLERGEVYITNILKCRPPRNRDPSPEETQCCEPYLLRQIALVRPRVILAAGRVAAQNLLRSKAPIGRLRGQRHVHTDTGIPLIVTYHPAYLLRSPLEKGKVWADLKILRRALAEADV